MTTHSLRSFDNAFLEFGHSSLGTDSLDHKRVINQRSAFVVKATLIFIRSTDDCNVSKKSSGLHKSRARF